MTDLLKTFGAGALALALLGAPAFAQDAFGDYDADGSGGVDESEFNEGFSERGVFDSYDEDGDGALSEDEYNSGVFGAYDDDDSGAVEEPEFGDYGDDIGDDGLFDI